MALNNFNPNSGKDDDSNNNTNNNGVPVGGGWPAFMPPPSVDNDADFDPEQYLINYNKKFQNSQPTLFRDEVIQQTVSCLIGKFKPNPLLVGPAGVGKTKITEDIARMIASSDPLVPPQIADCTIWELPVMNIMSGSRYVGDIEAKIKNIIDFAKNPDNHVILFIDEIHMLLNGESQYEKIAQFLKPALARGEIKTIGATTLQESQKFMHDPAFSRRFSRIIVDELSQDQTEEILKQMKVDMFGHYKNVIAITDKMIKDVVAVADSMKTAGSHRPDNAITLLDRAMADAYMSRQKKYVKAKRDNDQAMLAALNATPTMPLSKTQMKNTAMRLMTGCSEKSDVDLDDLKLKLDVVKGQDHVIEYLLDVIERDSLNIYPRTKPLTILFAGDSGVGKTEIAKITAECLTGTKPIILNMTEYNNPSAIARIIGAPPGYVGYSSNMELPFDILESNPYQVILLDEFEKSDRAVQRLFMSAFDEGVIKTSHGKTVDFSKAIIIATTNAGHTTRTESIGFTKTQDTDASVTDLSRFFDVELLNRFTQILNFKPMTEDLYSEIVCSVYERDVDRIKSVHSSYSFLPDTLPDDDLKDIITKTYQREFGARPAGKAVQKYIEDSIINAKRKSAVQTPNADANTEETNAED